MTTEWHLEGLVGDDERRLRIPITPLPFLIGRHSSCHIALSSPNISKRHAELFLRGDDLWIKDLGSTNGTFVNGERVEERKLLEADVLHFGSEEFRVALFMPGRGFRSHGTVALPTMSLPPRIAATTNEFHERLETRAFEVAFQPLVDLESEAVMGYEVLGRGSLGGQQVGPIELFMLAQEQERAVELSAVFREVGCSEAKILPGTPMIFFNTHPQELENPEKLLRSLTSLCPQSRDGRRLVLEIHESSVTDIAGLKTLKKELQHLDIGLAFDDFGTGQPRLLELAEVEADYLKFDIQMIHGLDRASDRRRDMVASLVALVRSFDLVPVAEGIETSGEAAACRDVGFPMGQGYHFARPAPASEFFDDDTQSVNTPEDEESEETL